MEEKVSEILENLLGLLGLEGSFEVDEKDDAVFVSIDAEDPGILIGRGGETLASLQLILNLISSRQFGAESKRIVVDVSEWRKSKEEDLASRTASWTQKVIESNEPMELEPMPAWQRRIVHMTVEQTSGVKSESVGEEPERRLVISPDGDKPVSVETEETDKPAADKPASDETETADKPDTDKSVSDKE